MWTRAPGPGSRLARSPRSRRYMPPVWRSWLMVVNRPPPVPRNVSSVNTLHGQLTLSPAFHRSGQGRGAGEEEKRKKVEEREEGWVPLPGRVGVVAGSGPGAGDAGQAL